MALFFYKIYGQNSFLSKQEKYSRVKTAISEKGEIIKTKLSQNNINIKTLQIKKIKIIDKKQSLCMIKL